VSQKTRHQTLVHILAKSIDRFSTFFTVTLGRKFAIKLSLQIPPNFKGVATLPCEILVSKNCSDWKHTSSTPSTHTVNECDRDWQAAAKQLCRDRNLAFSTSHSTICGRKDHFFHGDLGFKCPKRFLLKNWLKQTAMGDTISSKQLMNDVIFIWFSHKKLFTLIQQKNSQKGRL